MIKVKFKPCQECVKQGDERDKPMANNGLGLCQYHNNKIKSEKAKSKPKPKQVSSSGYMELYREIWSERKHVSELSGKPIPEFSVWCFMHVLNKNTYKKFALNKRNIFLVLTEEHHQYDNVGRKDLETEPMWSKVFERRIELLRDAYGVKQ